MKNCEICYLIFNPWIHVWFVYWFGIFVNLVCYMNQLFLFDMHKREEELFWGQIKCNICLFSDFQIARNRAASNHWPTILEVDRTLSFLTERIGNTAPFSRPSQRRTTLGYARSMTRCQLWTPSSPAWRPRSGGSPRLWSPWRERWRSILNSTIYSREK